MKTALARLACQNIPKRYLVQIQAGITTPLILKTSEGPEKPEIFDGQRMLIDLWKRVSNRDWIINDGLRSSQSDFLKSHGCEPRIAGQTAGGYLNAR